MPQTGFDAISNSLESSAGSRFRYFVPPYSHESVLSYHQRAEQGILAGRRVQSLLKESGSLPDFQGILSSLPQSKLEGSQVEIWNANPKKCLISSIQGQNLPLAAAQDEDAIVCYHNLSKVDRFCREIFKTAPVQTLTGTLIGIVHSSTTKNNAGWDPKEERFYFGDSDSLFFNHFSRDFGIVAHEVGHALTQYSSSLLYEGQTGAINESWSDIFATTLKHYDANLSATDERASWLLGEGILVNPSGGTAIRSLKAPGTAYEDHPLLHIKDPQAADMDGYVQTETDHGGVHANSGIPNRAFYLAATSIGNPTWEAIGQIWFEAIRTANQNESFAEFSRRTIDVSKRLQYPEGVANCIGQAWSTVKVQWRGKGDRLLPVPSAAVQLGP